MTEHHHHEDTEIRARHIAWIDAGEDVSIEIEHVYDNATCPEHGGLSHDGMVGLTIHRGTGEEAECSAVLLDAAEALLLADRITRAAHLVLELDEGLPDIEREMLRHSERQDG